MTQFDFGIERSSLAIFIDGAFVMDGPLYKLTINAPPMDTIVPTNFARLLWTLNFSFSILINTHQLVNSIKEQGTSITKFVQDNKKISNFSFCLDY